jgi:hypothetical protein
MYMYIICMYVLYYIIIGIISKGCYFHFNQAIFRKCIQLGMKTNYESEVIFKSWIKMIMALALVPEHLIEEAFIILHDTAPAHPNMEDFCDYILLTWIQSKHGFSKALWNHYNSKIKSNNMQENYHGKLNNKVGNSHPHIYKILDIIKKQVKHLK